MYWAIDAILIGYVSFLTVTSGACLSFSNLLARNIAYSAYVNVNELNLHLFLPGVTSDCRKVSPGGAKHRCWT
jgi:hypothetical protein